MLKNVLLAAGLGISVGIIGFFIWASNPLGPMDIVDEMINQSDVEVIENKDFYRIGGMSKTGLIYYPGARVHPKSYIHLGIALADEDITTFISKMSLNFAVFSPNKALEIIKDHPEIKEWFIAGHSLGGAMASKVVYENPDKFEGLILNASYPAENNSLKDKNIKVLSIYAEKDGLATIEEIDKSRDFLSTNTKYVLIDGGNHAQFGYYGPQKGDLEADISREQQIEIIVKEITEFIK